jgi:hypothetical protein
MNSLPVEEHIRGVVKDLLRTRGITKRGLVEDINGSLKIPYKGQKHRLSLQVKLCCLITFEIPFTFSIFSLLGISSL